MVVQKPINTNPRLKINQGVNFSTPKCFTLWRQCGPVVRTLGLHAAAPGSNPVLTSGLDLFPVVPDSTLPRFVNSQLVASRQLGFLMFLLSLNCYFHLVNSGVPVN